MHNRNLTELRFEAPSPIFHKFRASEGRRLSVRHYDCRVRDFIYLY